MQPLLVQKFLEDHSFGELAQNHGVYASFSKDGQVWSLNYDQLEAKESDPLSQQCRGLILSLEDGGAVQGEIINDKINRDHIIPGKTKILAGPMFRFFNHGQGQSTINWSDPTLKVCEKLDGTLAILWFNPFKQEWFMATRSVPYADLLMDNGIYTFRTLFDKALKSTTGLDFPTFTRDLPTTHTFCFELTTPLNRIVVAYPDYKLTLLAARNLETGIEEDPHSFAHILKGIKVAEEHSFSTVDNLLSWVSSLNPIEHEGVVVKDGNFNRIKVKNASYVAMSKIRDRLGSSERNLIEIIMKEKDDDVKQFLAEELILNMEKLKGGLILALQSHDQKFADIKSKVDPNSPSKQKNFALLVNAEKGLWSAPMFQMYAGKCANMRDFLLKAQKEGSWPDSFLDRVLEMAKKAID